MSRLIISVLLAILSLTSCDKLLKASKQRNNASVENQLQINHPSKPEIVAAFQAIAKATNEHNRVYLQNHNAGKPANELAYSAGIAHLVNSAREHGGLAKQIINAVAATRSYEKGLFTPFDTIDRQLDGMPTWSASQATLLRGYIQIIDQINSTYDGALAYLERGKNPLQRRNFDKYGVPAEVSAEFFRLGELHGKEVTESELGMLREQRAALQCSRDALTTTDPVKANQLSTDAEQHEQKSKEFEARMLDAIRKQLSESNMP